MLCNLLVDFIYVWKFIWLILFCWSLYSITFIHEGWSPWGNWGCNKVVEGWYWGTGILCLCFYLSFWILLLQIFPDNMFAGRKDLYVRCKTHFCHLPYKFIHPILNTYCWIYFMDVPIIMLVIFITKSSFWITFRFNF